MATDLQLSLRRKLLTTASKRRGPRTPTIPLARPPTAVVLEYGTILADMLAELDTAIRRALEHADILTRQDKEGESVLASQAAAAVAKMKHETSLVLNVHAFGAKLQRIGERTAAWSGAEFQRQLHAAFGVDLLADATVGPILRKFREENVRLIRDISEEKIRRVQAVITEAPLHGRHEALVDKIQEATGFSTARARLIARDQVLRLYGTVNQARHEAAGITHYKWITSRDERVRDGHKALGELSDRGSLFSYAQPPIVDPASGRRANPGQDFQCRCTASPVIAVDS